MVEPFCQKHTFFPEDTQVDRIMLEFTGLESLAAIARDEKHDLSEFRKKVHIALTPLELAKTCKEGCSMDPCPLI